MPEPDAILPGSQPLFSGVQRQAAGLAGDLRWAAARRWELARLELTLAAMEVRRLTIRLVVAIVLAVGILPLGLVLLSEWLGGVTQLSRMAWLGISLLVLFVSAPGAAWLAWRGFRRNFVGFEATLEELREDLKWLDEYLPPAKPRNQS